MSLIGILKHSKIREQKEFHIRSKGDGIIFATFANTAYKIGIKEKIT
jgi:hypothetical protein